MINIPLDESCRGKISLVIVEDGREVWLDMVDYAARFGRKHLEDRLAEADLLLAGEDEQGEAAMIANPAERMCELEADLAAERARVAELRHILVAMGAAPFSVADRVPELIIQIAEIRREAQALEEEIADASYRPEPNAAVEGADAPEDAAA